MNGFEKREMVGDPYWKDSRWEEVRRLRVDGEDAKANGIVCIIRRDWGVE